MPRVIVFDVIETLLDLRALDPHFARIFGDAAVRQQWFMQMLQTAMVAALTHTYADFGAVGRAALDMVATRHGIELSDDERNQILSTVRALPPHPEVRDNLQRLRDAGLRLAALTNSTAQTAEAQLTHAGLREFFEQVLTVDTVRTFKPAAEVYRMAAQSLGVQPHQMRLVAAHDWDVTGAIRAGCAAAFIARPGKVLSPLGERPDIIGADLGEVAEQILAVERAGASR